jgi:hypothetical protein
MTDALLLAWMLVAWGAVAAVPWRLAGEAAGSGGRRGWALALLPLLASGAFAAYGHLQIHPDAAVVQEIYPFGTSGMARIVAVLFVALALAAGFAAATWRDLEATGWRIVAGFGLVFLLAASWAGELIRTGEGPASAPLAFVALILLRTLVALGAAEAVAPGPPRLATAAGLALPLYTLLLPGPLAQALAAHGRWTPLAAATLLFLAGSRLPARLPARLARAALLGAALLAGLWLAQAASLSEQLSTRPLPPLPSLPASR